MENGRIIYWLDDERDPKVFLPERKRSDTVIWIKDYKTFKNRIIEYLLPDVIWFDHDLGEGKTGKDCADFLVDYCLDCGQPLPEYHSQSQNPVGKENIIKLLDSYNNFYKKNIEK